MNFRLIYLLPLLLFLLLLLFFWKGLGKDPNLLPSMLVDKPIPKFNLPSLDSGFVSNQQFYGRVTLLNVWASWCDGCQIERPILIDLSKNNGVTIVGLNYKDNKQAALNFLLKGGNPYQKVIYDKTGSLSMRFGVYGTPETFLIDKKGIVRYRYVGPITLQALESDLLPRISRLEQEGNNG